MTLRYSIPMPMYTNKMRGKNLACSNVPGLDVCFPGPWDYTCTCTRLLRPHAFTDEKLLIIFISIIYTSKKALIGREVLGGGGRISLPMVKLSLILWIYTVWFWEQPMLTWQLLTFTCDDPSPKQFYSGDHWSPNLCSLYTSPPSPTPKRASLPSLSSLS